METPKLQYCAIIQSEYCKFTIMPSEEMPDGFDIVQKELESQPITISLSIDELSLLHDAIGELLNR